MKNPWNAECIKMRAKFDPIYSVEVSPQQKTLHPRHHQGQGFRYGPMARKILTETNMCFCNVKYWVSSPGRGDRKIPSRGLVLCVRGFVFLGVCCLLEIGAGLSRGSMPHWVIACSSIRGAPTVFKCVWHVLEL